MPPHRKGPPLSPPPPHPVQCHFGRPPKNINVAVCPRRCSPLPLFFIFHPGFSPLPTPGPSSETFQHPTVPTKLINPKIQNYTPQVRSPPPGPGVKALFFLLIPPKKSRARVGFIDFSTQVPRCSPAFGHPRDFAFGKIRCKKKKKKKNLEKKIKTTKTTPETQQTPAANHGPMSFFRPSLPPPSLPKWGKSGFLGEIDRVLLPGTT